MILGLLVSQELSAFLNLAFRASSELTGLEGLMDSGYWVREGIWILIKIWMEFGLGLWPRASGIWRCALRAQLSSIAPQL